MSALDEPIVSLSIDHLPFNGMGVDGSVTFQQNFPLSRVRGHRRRGAEANARRELAQAETVERDVELDAVRAFWMLAEARATAEITVKQKELADQLVKAAMARYSASMGTQSDVMRAQIEVSRLGAEQRATAAEARSAEVMLNTSLARDPAGSIPDLDVTVSDAQPAPADRVARASQKRPELQAGRAEIDQAEADVRVMSTRRWRWCRPGRRTRWKRAPGAHGRRHDSAVARQAARGRQRGEGHGRHGEGRPRRDATDG